MKIKLEIPIKYTGLIDAMYAKFTHFKALIWILCLNIMLLTDMQWKIMLELWHNSMDISFSKSIHRPWIHIMELFMLFEFRMVVWSGNNCFHSFYHNLVHSRSFDLKWSANIYFRLRVHKIRIKNRQTFSLRQDFVSHIFKLFCRSQKNIFIYHKASESYSERYFILIEVDSIICLRTTLILVKFMQESDRGWNLFDGKIRFIEKSGIQIFQILLLLIKEYE